MPDDWFRYCPPANTTLRFNLSWNRSLPFIAGAESCHLPSIAAGQSRNSYAPAARVESRTGWPPESRAATAPLDIVIRSLGILSLLPTRVAAAAAKTPTEHNTTSLLSSRLGSFPTCTPSDGTRNILYYLLSLRRRSTRHVEPVAAVTPSDTEHQEHPGSRCASGQARRSLATRP